MLPASRSEHAPVRTLFATAMLLIGGTGTAFAQCATANIALCNAQTADQESLLSSFNALPNSTAGQALLNANLQTENTIYLTATPAQKIASSTILVVSTVPANILLRAFPQNPNYHYDSAGLATAPPIPQSVEAALEAITFNAQLNNIKADFGLPADVYGHAYGLLPGQIDSLGNPPPYQVSAAIHGNPFTAANSSASAAANQQTPGTLNVNWQGLTPGSDSMTADFPSAHTMLATFDAITAAVLAPGYYQQLAQSVEDFAYDLNVFGVHYPLDVVGGRILGTYVLAQTLSGNPLYPSSVPATLASLSEAMRSYLGGGASSPYAAACAGNVAGCLANGAIPSATTYARQIQAYTNALTYGLPSVGATNAPPVVPQGVSALIATRFPYLSTTQLNDVLASTELPSGVPLDDGSGWARINLYAAASGYGAFTSNVTVNMNAALGGLNAFDIWSNAISGPGGLTLQGSGTLILAGNNLYTGDTVVQAGTLGLSGAVAGNIVVHAGGSFAGNGLIGGSMTLLGGSSYLAAVGVSGANVVRLGGAAVVSEESTLVITSSGSRSLLGNAWPIVIAAGGVSGQFGSVTEPPGGIRFDPQYANHTISLLATPRSYGNLAAAGMAESSSEISIGATLDAIRPAPGLTLDASHAALFDPLYVLPATLIARGLDQLAPSIYPDAMITARNAWYLIANAVSGQLAARRGLAAVHETNSAPGPSDSTIWVSGLSGYDGIRAGAAPGFTDELSGTAVGIDAPVSETARIGVATGTVVGQTWSHASGNANGNTAQIIAYGQWQSDLIFADAQLGLMYLQEDAHRDLSLFGTSARGATNGLGAGGEARIGVQQNLAGWLIQPSLGFGGFDLHLGRVAEDSGILAENIGRATLGSARTTLAVTAQRGLALSEQIRLVVSGRLGWSHEFADTAASVSASFQGFRGIGFTLDSASTGRNAALLGLRADIDGLSWPVKVFVGCGGAISGSSNAGSVDAGLRFTW